MATPTYTSLATITLGSSAASVTFSNIPTTYRDLILITNSKVTDSEIEMNLIFNGSSTNLPWVRILGYSSGLTTSSASNPYPTTGITGDGVQILQIFDYSATNKHKPFLIRKSFGTISWSDTIAGRYPSTSAITSITLDPFSYNLASGFTASLYGVAG